MQVKAGEGGLIRVIKGNKKTGGGIFRTAGFLERMRLHFSGYPARSSPKPPGFRAGDRGTIHRITKKFGQELPRFFSSTTGKGGGI